LSPCNCHYCWLLFFKAKKRGWTFFFFFTLVFDMQGANLGRQSHRTVFLSVVIGSFFCLKWNTTRMRNPDYDTSATFTGKDSMDGGLHARMRTLHCSVCTCS